MDLRRITQRLRQHHGIEHATVTLLSQRLPGALIAGHSDLQGFTIYGRVDTALLRAAAEEALARLAQGERGLAVHPNCGTNLVAAGLLSGAAALVAAGGQKRSWWWDRLPSAVLAATLALMVVPAVGRWAQEHLTTSAEVRGLRVVDIIARTDALPARHRVVLRELL